MFVLLTTQIRSKLKLRTQLLVTSRSSCLIARGLQTGILTVLCRNKIGRRPKLLKMHSSCIMLERESRTSQFDWNINLAMTWTNSIDGFWKNHLTASNIWNKYRYSFDFLQTRQWPFLQITVGWCHYFMFHTMFSKANNGQAVTQNRYHLLNCFVICQGIKCISERGK